VFASDTISGWYPQIPLYEIPIPAFFSSKVSTIGPSTSMTAVPRSAAGCRFQIETRSRITVSISATTPPARTAGGSPPPSSGTGSAAPPGGRVRLVPPQALQILEPRVPREYVLREVQHVVRLVVGQVHLQQRQRLVDRACRAALPSTASTGGSSITRRIVRADAPVSREVSFRLIPARLRTWISWRLSIVCMLPPSPDTGTGIRAARQAASAARNDVSEALVIASRLPGGSGQSFRNRSGQSSRNSHPPRRMAAVNRATKSASRNTHRHRVCTPPADGRTARRL